MTTAKVTLTITAGLLLGFSTLSPIPASAALIADPSVAATARAAPAGLEEARWVCGPYRCWWRPNYFYAPVRRWGWGWRRPWYGYGWHRPWGYGWHRGWG